jgi:hypothetical protein
VAAVLLELVSEMKVLAQVAVELFWDLEEEFLD